MAAEAITKFEPHRTLYMRAFDRRGAAAAIHSASATGFTASGVFRDQADFCVIVLWDEDDFSEPPRLKYLPDPNLTGIVLSFDLLYTGLEPIDSNKSEFVPFHSMSYIREDGSSGTIALSPHATQNRGTYTKA